MAKLSPQLLTSALVLKLLLFQNDHLRFVFSLVYF